MITVQITRADGNKIRVDRDSNKNAQGREGFVIDIAGVRLQFEDEEDAIILARMVLRRLGESFNN